MATRLTFTEEELMIDETLGYPKAYAKLCRDPHLSPYWHGPPFTFVPYALPSQEVSRAKELDHLFPVIDLEAKPSTKPKIYANILWKQLNHLGNAGFDPAQIRVDPYGNVLFYNADSDSPLAWEIDHWFPCARGGRTVPSNLRLLQWQVYKKKHNNLEFLVPWWDFQLGVSVNQFLAIFASSNSDFRKRAFSLFFFEAENEELNSSQTVDSHAFPQHFIESQKKVGLAAAAIVSTRREPLDASSTLRSIDLNRRLRASSPATDGRKSYGDANESLGNPKKTFRPNMSKENDDPDKGTNSYLTIAKARDSLRQREEMQAEIEKLDDELDELSHKNEVERVSLQDLELVLMKRRRRAEKSRRLAEAQSSYKALLEKMIRDAMHQSVVYKEQLRLNQAATGALMARLEAQKAICDSSERELHRKFKARGEIENQIRPHWEEQARKRSRLDDTLFEEREDRSLLMLPEPEIKQWKPLHKELRLFLQEEHNASEAGISLHEEKKELNNRVAGKTADYNKSLILAKDDAPIEEKFEKLEIEEVKKWMKSPVAQSPEKEEDEEGRQQRGKGNVEKWLQVLLDGSNEALSMELPHEKTKEDETIRTEELVENTSSNNPLKDIKITKFPESEVETGLKQTDGEKRRDEVAETEDSVVSEKIHDTNEVGKGIGSRKSYEGKDRRERSEKNPLKDMKSSNIEKRRDQVEMESSNLSAKCHITHDVGKGIGSSMSFEGKNRKERSSKERGLARSESARSFRATPYSPSVILGMKKGVDCIGKKPIVIGSDEDGDEDNQVGNNFFKSSIKTIKKAVKI